MEMFKMSKQMIFDFVKKLQDLMNVYMRIFMPLVKLIKSVNKVIINFLFLYFNNLIKRFERYKGYLNLNLGELNESFNG